MKFLRSLLLLTLLSSVLLACGGAETPTTVPTADTAASATDVAAEVNEISETAVATEAVATEVVATEADPNAPVEATAAPAGGTLVVYSGRSESLVQPLLDMFSEDTGIEVEVRYGDTAEMAAQILEEGDNSPADVFYGQDAGALGALSEQFVPLDQELLERVDPRFRSQAGTWVGTSGRARVLVYNPDRVSADELPQSITELSDPEWQGRIGWAPTNGSFQAFVTALRVAQGDDAARTWLEGMQANDTQVYEKNSAIVQAVAAGEVDAGLVNHYYLFAARKDTPDIRAENYYFPDGDIGSLINVAGTGIVATGANQEAARTFVDYLLSPKAQQYFAEQTFEYPLVEGITISDQITPLSEISTPDIDLSNLEDLEGTLQLLQDSGVIQ